MSLNAHDSRLDGIDQFKSELKFIKDQYTKVSNQIQAELSRQKRDAGIIKTLQESQDKLLMVLDNRQKDLAFLLSKKSKIILLISYNMFVLVGAFSINENVVVVPPATVPGVCSGSVSLLFTVF